MAKRIKFKFILMRHWGLIYILPLLEVNIVYSIPTITISWWVFRLDIIIHYRLPDWFMEYIWGFFQLDFIDWINNKIYENKEKR